MSHVINTILTVRFIGRAYAFRRSHLMFLPRSSVIMKGERLSTGSLHQLNYVAGFVLIEFVGDLEFLKYVISAFTTRFSSSVSAVGLCIIQPHH